MDKRKILIATNIAIAVGGTSFIGYTGYKVHEESQAREQRVGQLVQRFHGCPDRFRASQECFEDNERQRIFQGAERAEHEHRWEDAAVGYASLTRSSGDEMETKAREMAGNCAQETRRGINDSIRVRQEAIRRVSQEAPQPRAAPAVSIDAGIPDAQPAPIDAGAEAQDAGPQDAAPEQRTVTITFRANPSGVDVRLGDESRCTASPECTVSFPAGSWGLEFNFRMEGYRSQTRTVTPDQDRTVEVSLQRERSGGHHGTHHGTSPVHSAPPVQTQPTTRPGIISSPD